jgi:hypothetical protein
MFLPGYSAIGEIALLGRYWQDGYLCHGDDLLPAIVAQRERKTHKDTEKVELADLIQMEICPSAV